MGICFGRSLLATHDQEEHMYESTGCKLHTIRKCLNPELKLQCNGSDQSTQTKLAAFFATSHRKPFINEDHAGRGAVYRIKVRIPAKQLARIFSRGNISKKEAFETSVMQKQGARHGVKYKASLNSWRPSLESISEEEAQTNYQNS